MSGGGGGGGGRRGGRERSDIWWSEREGDVFRNCLFHQRLSDSEGTPVGVNVTQSGRKRKWGCRNSRTEFGSSHVSEKICEGVEKGKSDRERERERERDVWTDKEIGRRRLEQITVTLITNAILQ